MHTDTLTISQPLPFAVVPALDVEEERQAEPLEMKRLSHLQRVITISDKQLCELLSAFGAFKRDPDRLEPREINHSLMSAWKAGREKMPRWRLAECVVLVEFIGCLRTAEANAILASPDAPERKKTRAKMQLSVLRHTVADLHALETQPDLQEFLPVFRQALALRLETDQNLSEADRLRFEIWCGRFPSTAAGKTKAKNEKKHIRRQYK